MMQVLVKLKEEKTLNELLVFCVFFIYIFKKNTISYFKFDVNLIFK
ncbi:hypothetical protein RIR_e32088_A0A2N0NX59_9GLOM [Rhizophagus irregularis DAOM 181602=DAOM 197198]|nr:hypothetical protein RIR_e32088_A0A2N0NX59_9GLOM [Rhizophagus irregularis DAOM 181602=DAOM 197198]